MGGSFNFCKVFGTQFRLHYTWFIIFPLVTISLSWYIFPYILGGIFMMFILREWLGILWLALLSWFLQNAASASYRQTQWRKALHEFTASQVMFSDYAVFPPNITVSELIQRYILYTGHRFFLVATEERFTRVLTLHNIKSVSQHSF